MGYISVPAHYTYSLLGLLAVRVLYRITLPVGAVNAWGARGEKEVRAGAGHLVRPLRSDAGLNGAVG